jgi:glycosyltransferase involved in cell wall biosynthesis
MSGAGMRIVFFSHYYPPEVNAPASRTSEHVRVWARAGHDVVVITCAPNHPGGKIYPGYTNRLYQIETIDGIRIVRVWTYLAANEGFVRRAINYLSYAVSATLAMVWIERPDVVVSTSPQFFCGLTGLIAQTIRRTPWVLEIRDLWPESIVTVGAMRKGLTVRLLERLEALAYRRADRIVSVTDSFVPHIVAHGGAEAKISVIKNGANLDLFAPANDGRDVKRRLGLEGRFVAAYVGTHGIAHGLDTILEAADRLREESRIVFLLVGDGAERQRLERRKQEMRLNNVVMLGQQPKEAMPGIWAATDAGLILLRHDDLFKTVLPSKMFEAMAMRRPIIVGVEGESRALLEEAGAGIAITPESAEELAAAVTRLADDRELAARLGASGCAHVREHYDRARLAMRYLEVLEDCTRSAKSPASRDAARSTTVVGQ